MPVSIIHRYTCPVTAQTADVAVGDDAPDGWFTLNGDFYAPQAQAVFAARISRGITDPTQLVAPLGTVTGDSS